MNTWEILVFECYGGTVPPTMSGGRGKVVALHTTTESLYPVRDSLILGGYSYNSVQEVLKDGWEPIGAMGCPGWTLYFKRLDRGENPNEMNVPSGVALPGSYK